MIYFDEPTQVKIWSRFSQLLPEGGHLYIGHSERVSGPAAARLIPDPVVMVAELFGPQIRKLEREIVDQTASLAGGRGSLSSTSVRYQELRLASEYAEKQLAIALTAYQEARHWLGQQQELLMFHWHFETFQIPAGCKRLLYGRFCLNKAFS